MAPTLESGVRRRMEDPAEGEEVTLLVKVTEASDSIVERAEEQGATVEDTLPLNYLALRIAEKDLPKLCEMDMVTRVEIEGEGAVMNSNFHNHPGPVL